MRRYRRSNSDVLFKLIGMLIYYAIYLYILLIYYAIKVLLFFVHLILFYRTKYKQKSGNSFFKTYFDKGTWAEYKLYRKLIKVFGEDKLLTNLYLPSQNIDNTEIDVLGVHNGVIYCFEVKNYGGYLYGRKNDEYWTQVLKYRTKNRFYNPIRQNYAHTKALESYLSIEEKDIIPILAFSNRSNLDNVDLNEVNMIRLNTTFYPIENKVGKYSDEYLIEKLSMRSNVNEQVKQEHIEQINNLKEERGI